ncbi:Rik1-associated factor 1 [Clathrospora elynae]|uniref:Rik1-associated factor 1 n=1 Tax=Clathrospora elynae TaxID=706981 RepID=A0A6A5S9C4_9PLEO|nr:Rik1-associated factor 1 [Clathrospora elynae]
MALSDWRHAVIDLTEDSDDDGGPLSSFSIATAATNSPDAPFSAASRHSHTPSLAVRPPNNPHVPLPSSHVRTPPAHATIAAKDKQPCNGITPPTSSSRSASAASMGRSVAVSNNYVPVPGNAQTGTAESSYPERAAKRMKMHVPGEASSPTAIRGKPNAASRNKFTDRHHTSSGIASGASTTANGMSPYAIPRANMVNKTPSVQDMNRTLKTNTLSISFLEETAASQPRSLQIGRIAPNGDSSAVRPIVNTSRSAPSTTSHTGFGAQKQPQVQSEQRAPIQHHVARNANRPKSTAINAAAPPTQATIRPSMAAMSKPASRRIYFSGPMQSPRDEDYESVVSDFLPTIPTPSIPALAYMPISNTPKQSSRRKGHTNQYNEAQDYFLIFLKEVKQLGWKQITAEFNTDMPHRELHSLESRYSTILKKRDRSQDPAVLTLPARFATETAIDWPAVHRNAGPRWRNQFSFSRQDAAPVQQQRQEFAAPRPFPIRKSTEQDYSSRGDSARRRERARRAERVDYTWPKQHRGFSGDQIEATEVDAGTLVSDDAAMRSETHYEEDAQVPNAAFAVENEPLNMDFNAENARLGLDLRPGLPGTSIQRTPYLAAAQRSLLQNPPACSDWDQLSSRSWQGALLHVDFSPAEVGIVKKAITKVQGLYTRSRHGTGRRQLRDLLRPLTEPKILKLISELQRHLLCRDMSSISAFLKDAQAGNIAETPKVQRLAAARPNDKMSSTQKNSTSSILRQRELGRQSNRGWQRATKPLSYQVKNKYLDTLGPAACWIGASSDIHTLAWSPDGRSFAAGAVAVDDPDSMQYNRPNNLLFGETSHGTIYELGEHWTRRKPTESGANSTHAMFVSQDPKIYNSVSSVAFSTSGRLMFSAGYDPSVCIWYVRPDATQPVLGAKIRFKAHIDMMTVNRVYDGVVATAAKISNEKAVRILKLNEEDPSQFEKFNFCSSKAVSRTDLKILPTALQFEPRFGGLLLAGFGANMNESGFDTTGDICLWDVLSESQLHIQGSNKNVFDVEFNPNRSRMPLFAVGCVAGANVNRGTRSLIRLYDQNELGAFRCPIEIECKALDVNDVVWCPHDEYLISAGCTDGRAYVWDLRWSDDPIRTLSHSRSLMPLQDDVKPEVTDTGVRFLSWGENATRLYSGSSDGVVKVWDVTRAEENTFIKDLVAADSGIMSGAFSSDYSKLVLGEVNGSVNVLEVGREDCSIKDAEKLHYVPYPHQEDEEELNRDSMTAPRASESGIVEGNGLLQSGQLKLAPMGSLPIRHIVQGPNYAGPYDQSVDAPFLREQALAFQLSLTAPRGPQCNIPACSDNLNKVTSEEIGDSGRSADRIPDELRRQWKALDFTRIVPGKSKCTHCGRPARLSLNTADSEAAILCERCSFACFRCGSVNPIAPATITLICDSCAGVWDIGALGYECVQRPVLAGAALDVPPLKRFGKDAYLERLEDVDTSFGDEMNALTDYYYGLAIDRPESPPF